MKLLLADDEPDMIRALSAILTHEGYKVDAAYDGAEALEKAAAVSYDGLILDIMMPKLDGLAVLSALRDKDILTPVLLLTAKSQTEDKISEFLARVRALTRRSAAKQLSGLTCGNFTLDRASMELSCGTSSVCLSSREAAMLELFIREEGRLLTETQLLEHTWGSTSYDEGASDPLPPTQEAQLVWTYVSYLRKKMQALGANRSIQRTEEGYRLTAADA